MLPRESYTHFCLSSTARRRNPEYKVYYVKVRVSKNGPYTLRRNIYKRILGAPMGDVCLLECYRDIRCQSFNYVISQNMCELNIRTKEARPEDFVPDSDRYYFERDWNRVHLGSIPDLPAESCQEIKGSEGEWAVSEKYWLYFAEIAKTVLAYCNMKTEVFDIHL
ncbi:hypothetical protein ACROYT_G032522 [Oculina patagonica]